MSMFVALTPLDATHFESGTAGDGQILTADGAGGAAWEDAAGGGGGGASFAYDGATFTPGPFLSDQYYRNITVDLTLGGTPVPNGMYMLTVGAKAWMYDSFFAQLMLSIETPGGANGTAWAPNNGITHIMYNKIDGGDPLVFSISTDSDGEKTARVFLALPDGHIVHTSMQLPGGGA